MSVSPHLYENTFNLPAPPDAVFAALTEPRRLEDWFAESVEVQPVAGGSYRFWGRHTPGAPRPAEADQRVLEIEPQKRLSFSWNWSGVPSRVDLLLEAAPYKGFPIGGSEPEPIPGCTLTVRHELEGTLPFPRPENLVDDHWRLATGNLFSHLRGDGNVVLPDYADDSAEVHLEIEIEAPAAAVFRALTEPEALDQWFAQGAKVEPVPGGVFDLGWSYEVAGNTVDGVCRIIEIEPDRKLSLAWKDWRGNPEIPDQRVTWELEERDGKTRVKLSHTGFERAADRSDYQQGWTGFLDGLRHVAESLAAA